MDNRKKTRDELITELEELQERFKELEELDSGRKTEKDGPYYSESFLQKIINGTDDLIYIKDEKYRCVFLNDRCCEITGLSRNEALGNDDYYVFSGGEPGSLRKIEEDILKTGKTYFSEDCVEYMGQTVIFSNKKSQFIDPITGDKYIITISRDITEQKRAEEEIAKLTRFQENIIDNANIWLDVLDAEGNIVIWNKAAENISGYTREEVIAHGQEIWEWFYPDDEYRNMITKKANEIINEYKVLENFETRIRCKNGEMKYISWYSRNLLDENRIPTGSIALGLDITGQKQADEKLRFRAMLLENIQDRITATDLEGHITYVNRADCKMMGYKQEELLEKSVYTYGEDPAEGATQREIIEATKEKGEWKGEIVNFDLKGNRHIIECHTWLLHDENGVPDGMCGISREISEQRKTVDALRESEERFRSFVDQSPVSIQILDVNGMTIHVNKAWEKLWGVPWEKFVTFEYNMLEDKQVEKLGLMHYIEKALSGSAVSVPEKEYDVQKTSGVGNKCWVKAWIYPIKDKSGSVKNIILTQEDITERKKAEEARKQNELRLSSMLILNEMSEKEKHEISDYALNTAVSLSNSEIGFIGFANNDESGFTVYSWSDSVYKECGIKDKPIEFPIESSGLWSKAIRERKPIMVNNYTKCDNTWKKGYPEGHIPIQNYLSIPLIDRDKVVVIITVANKREHYNKDDILQLQLLIDSVWRLIERKDNEEKLRKSERRYRFVVENSATAITHFDEKGTYLFLNDIALRWIREMGHDFSIEDIENKLSIHDIFSEDTADFFLERLRRIIKIGAGETTEEEVESLGRWISSSYMPIRDNIGKTVGVQVVTQDITDRKHLEEERAKASKLESIGFLAGGIAHDFNNILAAILGNTSLAKMRLDYREEVNNLLTETENATIRATKLTRQLLTFAKGGTPVKETTELDDLIRETAGFSLRGSNVQYSSSIASDLWLTEVDRGQISQVIGNLVINAKQAMSEGGTISIKAKNTVVTSQNKLPLVDGNYVIISVKDKGHGIPAEQLTKIFDPYFTTKPAGSGLGLATCYSIIHRHSGHISVKSKPGIDTTFTIYLPASSKKMENKRIVEDQEEVLTGKILIMDDEKSITRIVTLMLTRLGNEVAAVGDGIEAIELYKKAMKAGKPFDVVIMDLTIPGGMGGREAIRNLLEIDPDVKAVVSSGYANDPVISNFRTYGFVGNISKPYKLDGLKRVLNDVLSEK